METIWQNTEQPLNTQISHGYISRTKKIAWSVPGPRLIAQIQEVGKHSASMFSKENTPMWHDIWFLIFFGSFLSIAHLRFGGLSIRYCRRGLFEELSRAFRNFLGHPGSSWGKIAGFPELLGVIEISGVVDVR